ncbi:hypothetical protein [Oxalobacter paraformigenes]|uniref:Uncharacterized protein n=1 Tax=Oxalobacter paraformigenes TaxID=556268 RepID=C3X1V2_9BURK|nr:hypothetical protein [Oxalobacter paraformigenes]EEO27188.1 hypothetical protein OFAG_00341 [Oxalobacter paraformigenes]
MNTMFLNPDTWDLVVDVDGNIAMASDSYAIAQDVASACRLWKGEARYDTTRGMPYEQSILGQMPPMSMLNRWFENEAETVPEVGSVLPVLYLDRQHSTLAGQLQITRDNGEEISISVV